MTLRTNARIAGVTYLFYIAVAFPGMVLFDRAASGHGTAAKLASLVQHASDVRIAVVLSLLGCFSALVLAVTLYGITRNVDDELAMLGLACRVGEGILGAASLPKMLGLLSLATTAAGTNAADAAAANALGGFLLMPGVSGAGFFAFGSTVFSYLLLRGRLIPVSLASLGVFASALLVLALPAQLAGLLKGPVTWLLWMPMLVFEVVVALWLIIKGVSVRTTG